VFLPAGGLFQVLNRCTFSATEQVEACLLFALSTACRFGTVATAYGTLPAALLFRRLRRSAAFFAFE
jgi:hypothetical protein